MLTAWELVEHELAKGARSVDAAARGALLVGKDGRPMRKITMHDQSGRLLTVIFDAKKLRRWHDEFEKVLESAAPTSVIAQRAAQLRAHFASAATKVAYKQTAWQQGEYEGLRRAHEHGGRPISSKDLDRLFPL